MALARRGFWTLAGLLAALAAHNAVAQTSAPQTASPPASLTRPTLAQGFTLAQCLDLAEQNHPNIWGARARLDKMRAQLDEAHFTPYSQFTVTGGLGLAPNVYGNNLYSPTRDVFLTGSLGLGWRIGIEGVIPLWTFGKMTNLWKAADAQVDVGKWDVTKQKTLVRMDVRKAYFGLQMARAATQLLSEATDKLKNALTHLDQEVKAGNADEVDLLRLRTFSFELDGRGAEAHKYAGIALASLQFLTGQGPGFDIRADPLRVSKRALGPVAQYLQAARMNRPEINMARVGLLARQAQIDLARAKYFPDVGLGLSAVWARAPLVADQINPFIRDDANYSHYGAALVMRWQLDLLPNVARVAQASADLEELRQTERYALGGIGVEVETAYAQVVDAQTRERAYDGAERTARQWIIAIQQGIDVGTREDADLVDPARQWATQRYSHLTAMMDLNVAWSNLALATAWDDLAPPG